MKYLVLFLTLAFSVTAFAADKSKTVTLNVSGMTCSSCVNTVEKALKKVDGVKEVKVSLNEKKATVVLANTKTTTASLMKAVSDAGFTASEGKTASKTEMKKKKMEGADCEEGCCDDDCATETKSKKELKKS